MPLLLAAAAVAAAATAGPAAGSKPNIVFILSDGARPAPQLGLHLPAFGCLVPCRGLLAGMPAARQPGVA
jgi:hypothetical protein